MRIFQFAAILLVAMLFLPANASAHCEGKHTGDHPHCIDQSPEPEALDTLAHWSFDNSDAVYEYPPARECALGAINSDGSGGHYQCVVSDLRPVHFGLTGGQPLNRKGDPIGALGDSYCGDMGSRNLSKFTKFAYFWGEDGGDCTTSEGCTIGIQNWFYQDENRPPGTGLIIVEAFGIVRLATERNPFMDTYTDADGSEIEIERLVITFKNDGKNNVAATCLWSVDDFTIAPGDSEFHSSPAP